jgi:hypothetical protein
LRACGVHRQRELKDGPSRQVGFRRNPASVSFYNRTSNSQTNAEAVGLRRKKWIKEMNEMLCVEARTRIFDSD